MSDHTNNDNNGTDHEPEENLCSDTYYSPAARFECPICLSWLRDPVLTSCGHRFCKSCLYDWLEHKNPECPIDKMSLTKADIFPDNFTRREISQQKTKCPNLPRGCFVELSPLDVDSHVLVCPFRVQCNDLPENEKLRCVFVELGCTEKFEDEPQLQHHLEESLQKHVLLLSQSFSSMQRNAIGVAGPSGMEQQSRLWDANKQRNTGEGSNDSTDLISSLYEKIVILEQKTREQDIMINNLATQLSSYNLNVENSHPCNFGGCYLWYISGFKDKIAAMRRDSRITHYSPGFFTSPNGYKLCVRLNLSPKDINYVAVLIHVMKTQHDQTLDWPFSGRLIISIIHPFQSSKNIKETMMTRPDLDAFKRPVQEFNPKGFGYTEFASVEDLTCHGYVENDQLLIKVQAQPV